MLPTSTDKKHHPRSCQTCSTLWTRLAAGFLTARARMSWRLSLQRFTSPCTMTNGKRVPCVTNELHLSHYLDGQTHTVSARHTLCRLRHTLPCVYLHPRVPWEPQLPAPGGFQVLLTLKRSTTKTCWTNTMSLCMKNTLHLPALMYSRTSACWNVCCSLQEVS